MNQKRKVEELLSRSLVNIDKPSGPTSRSIDERIKEMLNLNKVGHAGTLDKRSTGVLILALDEATKAMPVLMGLDKEYEGVMYVHKDVPLKELKKVVSENFIGEIIQTPPLKSSVARKPRKRTVYAFDITGKDKKNIKFKTTVEAGTYIRKLCSDIGKKLSVGAHMKELRRTRVGHFSIEDSYTLEQVKKAWQSGKIEKILIPIEEAIPHVKKVWVKDSAVPLIRDGSPVFPSHLLKVQDGIKPKQTIAIFCSDRLIALGIAKASSAKILKAKRGSVVRTDRVFKG